LDALLAGASRFDSGKAFTINEQAWRDDEIHWHRGLWAIGKALIQRPKKATFGAHNAGVTIRTEKKGRTNFSRHLRIRRLFVVGRTGSTPAFDCRSRVALSYGTGEEAFAAGKDLMVISVGALLDHPRLWPNRAAPVAVSYVPSGAIAGWTASSPLPSVRLLM